MSFTNNIIAKHEISLTQIALNSLSPKYRKINLLLSCAFTLIVMAVPCFLKLELFFAMPSGYHDNFYWILLAIATLGLWDFIYHFFADPKKRYALREHDLHFQAGLIFRKHVSQPILRIQHIEIKRGPIERKAGLATLQVFSAGGAHHTFYIPGLEHDTAIKLRSFILDHTDLTLDE